MTQLHRFHDGGFVVHKIIIGGYVGHFSAWYGADGKLSDAEQFTHNGTRTRPVKLNGPLWAELQRVGRIYTENKA